MPTTKYICNLCFASYETLPEAEACEASHPRGNDFSVAAVRAYQGQWPDMIEVTDGKGSATYQLYSPSGKKEAGWVDGSGVLIAAVAVDPLAEEVAS